MLNCLKWRIHANDHKFISRSGIIDLLKEGNTNKQTGKNLIKKNWTEPIYFSYEIDHKTLIHIILEGLEFIIISWLSRLLIKDEDQSLVIRKTSSGISKIERAQSVVNKSVTEILLSSCFELIFHHLNQHYHKIEGIDLLENDLEEKKKNIDEENEYDIPVEFLSDEEDESTNRDIFDISGSKINRDRNESKKQNQKEEKSKYGHKVIVKLLRLLEVFTSIAIRNQRIHDFVTKITQSAQIIALARLLVSCKSRHGLIILKIFENLISIKFDRDILYKSFAKYKKSEVGKLVFDIETKTKFKDCPFLQFLYNLWFEIRSKQWRESETSKIGTYRLSCGIINVFKSILRSDIRPAWKKLIETAMDNFLEDIDSYSMTEFDMLTSLFEGGEFKGLTNGAFCQTKEGNKFIVIGFIKEWIDINSLNDQQNLQIDQATMEYSNCEQSLLGLLYDEKHSERNDLFVCKPDQVRIVSYFDKSPHDFLLDKDRLNMFLRAMEVSKLYKTDDIYSLYKRCTGIKILYENITIYGKQIVDLIDEDFKAQFITWMLQVCSSTKLDKSVPRYEWLNQSIFCNKMMATDEEKYFRFTHQNIIKFENEKITISLGLSSETKSFSPLFSKIIMMVLLKERNTKLYRLTVYYMNHMPWILYQL